MSPPKIKIGGDAVKVEESEEESSNQESSESQE